MSAIVPGVLFLYEDLLRSDATTIREHIQSFPAYSRYPWYLLNVTFGLPPALQDVEFAAIVFHYSLRPTFHWLTPELRTYLARYPAMKRLAIFQDEVWYFQEREQFLTECRIDCLYSRHKPQHVRAIYGPHLPVQEYRHYLAGYVADDLVARANAFAKPWAERTIDVGYRGRTLPYYFGRGSQEKCYIGTEFARRVAQAGPEHAGLTFDIGAEETDRIYGAAWDQFLASCRVVLGVEGGVSVIDKDGHFRAEYQRLKQANPALTFDEYAAQMGPAFAALEDRIDYRCLTPRHFESAAHRNLQVLFVGHYDGLMQPYRHYVPLQKDFSNIDEVLAIMRDPDRVQAITDAAYDDLIASGRYSYQRFIQSFDMHLGTFCPALQQRPEPATEAAVRVWLAEWARFRARELAFAQQRSHAATDAQTWPVAQVRYWRANDTLTLYQQLRTQFTRPDKFGQRLRRAIERYVWHRVEQQTGHAVPRHPDYDADARRLTLPEWLCAGGYESWLFIRKALRRLRRLVSR